MPLKDKEAYNNYMRTYRTRPEVKERQAQKTTQKIMNPKPFSNDFDGTNLPTLDLSKTSEFISKTREALKNEKTDGQNDDDPIIKFIDKYGKYAPYVIQFIQGFQNRQAEAQQQTFQQTQQPKREVIEAPIGWVGMSPLQRLNFKYSKPEWYAAGLRFDAFMETGSVQPSQAREMAYTPPVTRGAQQTDSRPAPQNMQELIRRNPEPPLINDSPLPPSETSQSEGVSPNLEGKTTPAGESSGEEKSNMLIEELKADNAKYLQIAIEWINKQTDETILDYVNNKESLIEKWKPFIPLIPIHVKGMIQATSTEELDTLLKEHCSTKYALLKEKNKITELLSVFEELKALLNK